MKKKWQKILNYSLLGAILGSSIGVGLSMVYTKNVIKTSPKINKSLMTSSLVKTNKSFIKSSFLASNTYNPDLSINLNTSNSYTSAYGSFNNDNDYYGPKTSSSNPSNYTYALSLNANNLSYDGVGLAYWTAPQLLNTINSTNFNDFMQQIVWSKFINGILNNNPSYSVYTNQLLSILDNVSFNFLNLIVTNSNDTINTNTIVNGASVYTSNAWNNLYAVTLPSGTSTQNTSLTSTSIENGIYLTYDISFPASILDALSNGTFNIDNKTINTNYSFLQFLGLNANDVINTNNTDTINGNLAINNLAVSINNQSLSYWSGLNNTSTISQTNNTINIPVNETSSYFKDLWQYDNAWLFNSDNINFNTQSNDFNSYINMQNYVLNSLFSTNDTTNTNEGILQNTTTANNIGLVVFNSTQTQNQNANLVDEAVSNASIQNNSSSNILLGNTGFYFGANSSYSFSSSLITDLKNFKNDNVYTLPNSIILTNLDYVPQTTSSFINGVSASNVPGNLKNLTAYQTWYNYVSNQKTNYNELDTYLNNISNSLLSNLQATISNAIPSIVLQQYFINGVSNTYISTDVSNSSNHTGYTNASSFYFDVNINNNAYKNRFVLFNNNNLSNDAKYLIVNSAIFNTMGLNTISSALLTNADTLPFNSAIVYNLNANNILPTTLNVREIDADLKLGYQNANGLKNVLGSQWESILQTWISSNQITQQDVLSKDKNNPYLFYDFGVNKYLSLNNTGYQIIQKNNDVYLSVPISNLSTNNNLVINGVVIQPNSTSNVLIQLTGYIKQVNVLWITVGLIIFVVLIVLFALLYLNRRKKQEGRGLSLYLNKMDMWRQKYFKEYADIQTKTNNKKNKTKTKWKFKKQNKKLIKKNKKEEKEESKQKM